MDLLALLLHFIETASFLPQGKSEKKRRPLPKKMDRR